MFVLFVDMQAKPGSQEALEKTYREIFRPAISAQEGLAGVELLRPNHHGGEYRLSISFASHDLQRQWVATELHQQVWPQMESHCADYSVQDYTSV